MGRPGFRAESLLAAAATVVGCIGIASALTPEFADRYDIVKGVLPPGVPHAARIVALAFGIGLIWLSRSIARRRRRAWWLAVLLVIGSAIAHLAKGLDFEEATISLLLLVALIRWRSRFDVPGNAETAPVLLVLGLVGGAAAAIVAGVELSVGDRLSDIFEAVGLLLGFSALVLWLRPLSHAVEQTVVERRAVRELVNAYGSDSLSFFALRRDKSYHFSPTRRAFLAYRVVAGAALISGDPVGDETELDTLLDDFAGFAHAHGWRLAVVGAAHENLRRYERLGMRAISIGDEAVIVPAEFSLEGRAIRKVRQSVSRLEKAGYRFGIVAADDLGPDERTQLDAVSNVWRGRQAERGFSMAMDDLYSPGTVFALAESPAGEIGGFLHLAPSPADAGWSLSTMRRRPDTPNGLTEFLVVRMLDWAKEQGAPEVSLNFCALTDFVAPDRALTVPRRLVRRLLLAADGVFQLERLHSFSRKFHPHWRPRYLCVERLTDLPLVGLAYLHVEQLLVPPGPWTRRERVSH
ncbi:MAG TPA: phosphatidylglycerol lysyltransferase domain-containing protein [Gaiellaceae bacterium]|nr:phosphatidylglycerol lysyltransferase domain-containing protein [Gaiellaceae bacterium]